VGFTTQGAEEDAHFELSFPPNARLVPTLRRFAAVFHGEALDSPDVAHG
jgi:hypothetical protein